MANHGMGLAMSPKRDPRTGWQPKYCRHKSGQAYVRISGRQVYLGLHGSKESLKEYERVITEWRENQFDLPEKVHKDVLICELCAAYLKHIRAVHPPKKSNQSQKNASFNKYRIVVLLTDELYGDEFVKNFTTSHLHRIRNQLLTRNLTRGYVNNLVDNVRSMFRWGVEHGMVDVQIYQALMAVERLRKDRSPAKESGKVEPVSRTDLNKTIEYIDSPYNDLIRVHHLLGCRANEAYEMRVGDFKNVDGHWQYRPRAFKQNHLGIDLYYWVGPQAKAIIDKHSVGKGEDDYVFVDRKGKRIYQEKYRYVIQRACEELKIETWTPGQVRHLRATEIREAENAAGRHGGEGAQAVLRHQHMAVTERYAEKDKIAQRIQTEMG